MHKLCIGEDLHLQTKSSPAFAGLLERGKGGREVREGDARCGSRRNVFGKVENL
jgi:hypothetical protein